MSLISDSTSAALERALDLRFERHNLLSANVANADTPGYKPVDLTFEGALASAMDDVDPAPPGFATTDAQHLPPAVDPLPAEGEVVVRPDVTNSLDDNGVDMDREMARMADNRVHYEVAVEATRRRIGELVNVIASMGAL